MSRERSETPDDEFHDAIDAGDQVPVSAPRPPNAAEDKSHSHVYFELEKLREQAGNSAPSQGGETALSPEEKYSTAQRDATVVSKGEMPSKSNFGMIAKAKLLEATGFFQGGKKSHKGKEASKDQGEHAVTTDTSNHSSAAGYDCLWPANVQAKNTPHAGSPPADTCMGEENPESVYQLAKPLLFPTSSPPPIPRTSSPVSPSSSGKPVAEIYNTPVLHSDYPSPIHSSTPNASQLRSSAPSPHVTQGMAGSLYYLSTAVPVFEDPSLAPGASSSSVAARAAGEMQDNDTLQSSASSGSGINPSGNKGVQQGTGRAVPVDFITPVQIASPVQSDSTEYNRLYSRSTDTARLTESQKQRLAERGYGSLSSLASKESSRRQLHRGDSSIDEDEYSLDWGSEFDDEDFVDVEEDMDKILLQQGDPEGVAGAQAPDKPLPPKPQKQKGFSPKSLLFQGQPVETAKFYNSPEIEIGCLPVYINPDKHPPPELPPLPEGLTENQKKRRLIIDLIITSERSYLESLERIIKDYERAVLEYIPGHKSSLRPVFIEMREIISHHKMFQIELAENVKNWDKEEKIGDIFTASFSKTMLVRAYSVYVNNFAQAMDEIRILQRSRQNFDDFLKKQEKLGADRLSIFGLMVKPVQRFPQFIMVLQDLIKFTPTHHCDRRSLQLALTELENVAYKLNERKRHSEQKFQAKQVLRSLVRQKMHNLLGGGLEGDGGGISGLISGAGKGERRLLRCDDVEQVFGDFGNMRCKPRRLILMNDLIMCCKVIEKEQGGYRVEKLDLKWVAKLSDMELKDTALTPDMQKLLRKEPGKIHLISAQPEKPEDDPFHLYADLREMLHDYSVLEQVTSLLGSLKRSYVSHGLREELLHEVYQDLENMIRIKDEQLRVVNSCTIQLVNHSRSDRPQYVIQTQTAAIKEDWCTDLLLAKLALEKTNKLAWDLPTSSEDTEFDTVPAHFMKYVVVDRPKNYTKIRCASPIFLHPENLAHGLGVQHLWVCSSTPTHGQVSVLSIHNSRPALVESFKACNCDIMAAELVPGCGVVTTPDQFIFSQDTVWVATARSEILVFPLASEDGVRRNPLATLQTPGVVNAFKFVDERLFCGFEDGTMNVYSRVTFGGWSVARPTLLKFGQVAVKFHFIHEEDIWLSCGDKLSLLEIDSLVTKASHTLSANYESSISQVVKTGVGIWVSFLDSAYIKLYHLETMENLQEISIGNFVHRIKNEKLWTLSDKTENLVVTSLAESKGLLWIGTSAGVVLTLPLPRLSDGVPLYRGRPSISLHAHRGPVKFLVALHCASSTLEFNRNSSLRYTLKQRQSRRNIEREKVEMEESHKRKMKEEGRAAEVETVTGVDGTTILDSVPDNQAGRTAGAGPVDSVYAIASELPSSDYALASEIQSSRFQNGIGGGYSTLPALRSPTAEGVTISKALNKWEEDNECMGKDAIPFSAETISSSPKSNRNRPGADTAQNGTNTSVGVKRKESVDDTAIVMRRKLSFRSELANRIMVTTHSLSRSQIDLSVYTNEVEMYYDYLFEDETDFEECHDKFGSQTGKKEKKDKKDKGKNGSKDKALQKDKGLSNKFSKKSMTLSGPLETKLDPPTSFAQSIPKASPTTEPGNATNPGASASGTLIRSLVSPSKNAGFLRGFGTRATMSRKSNTNSAVIVLSGGDGYCDLDVSRNQFKMDDACVQLWLYKY